MCSLLHNTIVEDLKIKGFKINGLKKALKAAGFDHTLEEVRVPIPDAFIIAKRHCLSLLIVEVAVSHFPDYVMKWSDLWDAIELDVVVVDRSNIARLASNKNEIVDIVEMAKKLREWSWI